MVIGGGPGGLEAARVAALRGHDVTLYEMESKTGGQLNLAAVPPMKQEITKWLRYLNNQVEKAGVHVELNAFVNQDLIEKNKPDAVVIAVGSKPYIPSFPGIENPMVVTAHDVLAGKAVIPLATSLGKPGVPRANVVILGGGFVGCETADFLATNGDNPIVGHVSVSIVTSKTEIGLDMIPEIRTLLMMRLKEKNVTIVSSSIVKEILTDGVRIERNGVAEEMHGIDTIVLARGVKSADNLSDKINELVPEVYVIGDAKEPREALEAIHEGNKAGREL